MIYLTLNHQLRPEMDAEIIANLQRKGWQETTPPTFDPATEHAPEWVDGEWLVRAKTAEELAAEARKIWPTVADFWSEFLAPEKLAIANSTHEGVILLREELRMWRGEIWSDSPHVTDGLAGLVALGILTAERQTEILTL